MNWLNQVEHYQRAVLGFSTRIRKEHDMTDPTTAPPLPPDPRDATIAAQQTEIDSLKAQIAELQTAGAVTAGEVRADDTQTEAARKAELIGQGLSEVDATEQAAYEARIRFDQANTPPNVTV